MARLPQPGGDSGNWGDILNDYLLQAHKSDGILKDSTVTSAALASNSVTNAALADGSVSTSTVADGSITNSKIAPDALIKTQLAPSLRSELDGKISTVTANNAYATKRADVRYDPAMKPNGAIGGTMDTGEVLTTFASPTSPSPLSISAGLIVHTPNTGSNSAGYMQATLSGRVRRIGCRVQWPTNALGVVALVLPSAAWSTGVLPNAGFHLSVNGNGIWTLTRFTTGGSTTLASNQTHGRPTIVWGTGLVSIDVFIDPEKNKAVIAWPDRSVAVVSSIYFGSETANFAIWELFESNLGTPVADVSAAFAELWASTEVVTADMTYPTPLTAIASTAPAVYNVSGGLICDFTRAPIHEVTLVGNLTSLTFQNPPTRQGIYQIELVQDATGNRTLSGVSSFIRWAGGVAPTLSTTASRRDIFQFRHNGANYYEVSRSMNVG